MGGAYVEQLSSERGPDNPTTVDTPESISWGDPITGKGHIRFWVAETGGGNLKAGDLTLWCSDVNDIATAVQVTTSSTNAPFIISDSTGGADLADGCATSSRFGDWLSNTWVPGTYTDQSDLIPCPGLSNNTTELQVCIAPTANAGWGQAYYFWLKFSDGTPFNEYSAGFYWLTVPTVTVELPTAWTYLSRLAIDPTWRIINQKAASSAWSVIARVEQGIAWSTLDQLLASTAWGFIKRGSIDSAWTIRKQVFTETIWRIIDRVFDLEWKESGVVEVLGSAFGMAALFLDVTDLQPGENYSWRVRAVENGLVGNWSNWKSFSTVGAGLSLRRDIAWGVLGQKGKDLAWGVVNKHDLSIAWDIVFVEQALEAPVAWGIKSGKTQGTAWAYLAGSQLSRSTAWIIKGEQLEKALAWAINADIEFSTRLTLFKFYVSDLEVPISSFQLVLYSDKKAYLQVVVPNISLIDAISARTDGVLALYVASASISDFTIQEEEQVIAVAFDSLEVHRGASSKSLILSGYETDAQADARKTDPKTVTIDESWYNYKKTSGGSVSIRLVKPHTALRAGDVIDDGESIFVVNRINWIKSDAYHHLEITGAA